MSETSAFLIVGNLVVDLFLSGMEALPGAGGDDYTPGDVAILAHAPVLSIGGNGANVAYVLAGLGHQPQLLSAHGDDLFGTTARAWIEQRGVDARLIKRGTQATSLSVMATDRALNRQTYHHAGASDEFALDDVPDDVYRSARVVLVCSYPTCARLRDADKLAASMRTAKQGRAVTAIDIGPDTMRTLRLAEIADALPNIDYVFCNAHELHVFTECDEVGAGIAKVLDAGVRCVVAKQGAAGVLLGTAAGTVAVPGFAVDAKITVGAGDTFAAGFLFGVEAGWPDERSARFANALAAVMVSGTGGVLHSPTLDQVETFLQSRQL
jgi:sugar/nucleoside kinase (ribokinase family)